MDSALIIALANSGVAGVVVVLLVLGLLVPKWAYKRLEKENRHLRDALDFERKARLEASGQGAITTNQLLGALVGLAERNRELTGKDS